MSVIAPPPHDELELLIREARERQRRRRTRGAVAAALLAAAGMAVYALVGGSAPANLVTPPANAGGATGPLCRASQLSATAFFQGSSQTEVGGVKITNTSAAACSLPSGLPVVDVSWHGAPISLAERLLPASIDPVAHVARVLAPGMQASVLLQWFDQWFCGTRMQSYTFDPQFVLRWGSGLALAATAAGLPVPNCGKPGGSLAVSRPLVEP